MLRAGALSAISAIHFHLARADAHELGERALELARATGDPALRAEVTLNHSSTLIWSTHLERARSLLDPLLAEEQPS